jgi:uncharacterized protein YprB with RNaseH-like and TPR domain
MLSKIELKNILFLDIETVPLLESFDKLSSDEKLLFEQKTNYQRSREEIPVEDFYEKAGIWAEFGKIVCISVGFFTEKDGERLFRVKSFYGDERDILIGFSELLNQHFSQPEHLLCAHNGKEFDFPYIARRMVILGVEIPKKLNLFGKKPWEVPHLDTLELWKFGDYKHFTSLKLLTHVLGIPSPKDDIDGSQVAQVFYEEKNIQRIIDYCERDVIAVAQILLKFNKLPLLSETSILSIKDA